MHSELAAWNGGNPAPAGRQVGGSHGQVPELRWQNGRATGVAQAPICLP